jgi:hypothetical protein
VKLTPQGSPDLPASLTNLGGGLSDRYTRTGALADLKGAISAYQQAVDLTPQGSPELPRHLNNLGAGLSYRYIRTGALPDLEAAVSAYQQACVQGLDVSLEDALRGSRNWGAWALERAAWEEAAQAYGFGMKAIEPLLRIQLLRAGKECVFWPKMSTDSDLKMSADSGAK